MIDLQLMAKKLSQRSQHKAEDWHSALNAAVHDPAMSQMTDGEIELLMASMKTPQQLGWVLEVFRDSFMKMTSDMPFDYIIRHVQQSGQSLQEWLEALELAYQHNLQCKAPVELKNLVQLVVDVVAEQPLHTPPPSLVSAIKSKLISRG